MTGAPHHEPDADQLLPDTLAAIPAGEAAEKHRVLKRVALLLPLVALLALFMPTLPFEFVNHAGQHQLLDDPLIASLGWENLVRIFTSFSLGSYYPVRALSFAIDHALWGMYPEGLRLTNVLLHAANTLLLFALVRRLSRPLDPSDRAAGWWGCAAAAGLFALHPIVVEPVVWIGGRERLLMVFFALLCLHLHIWAGQARSSGRTVALHALAAVATACACMSNVAAATIPLLVVTYDLVVQRSVRRAFTGGWFLWPIAAAAVIAQRMGDRLGLEPGVVPEEGLKLGVIKRLSAAFDGYWIDIKSLAWPADLVAIYPKTVHALSSPTVLAGILLAALTLLLIWTVRRNRPALLGLLWFVIGLAPSSQVIAHPIHHADRFLYLPLVGLAVAVAAGVGAWLSSRVPRLAAAAALCVAFAAIVAVSARQSRLWRNAETLFAHNVAIYPDLVEARNNLGVALADRGDWPGSYEQFRRAAELTPDDPRVHFNLGMVCRQLTDEDAAGRHLEEAIRLRPAMPDAHYQLAEVRLSQSRPADAIACLQKEVELDEENAEAHNLLGMVLTAQGKDGEAAKHYRLALELQPRWPSVANNLAWVLATAADAEVRDGAEAVRLAEAAVRATGGMDAELIDTLAAAYAETSQFDRAITAAEQALDIARMRDDKELTEEVEARLALFRAGRPYHATATAPASP